MASTEPVVESSEDEREKEYNTYFLETFSEGAVPPSGYADEAVIFHVFRTFISHLRRSESPKKLLGCAARKWPNADRYLGLRSECQGRVQTDSFGMFRTGIRFLSRPLWLPGGTWRPARLLS